MIGLHQILIESCSLCQNRCEYCAHQGMRDNDPTYQMSLEDVKILIAYFQKINCKIGNIAIHGPAEPLLWRHLNDAILLFAKSKLTDTEVVNGIRIKDASKKEGIMVVTNGRLLHSLNKILSEEAWGKITLFWVSLYGYPIDTSVLEKHLDRVTYINKPTFDHIEEKSLPFNSFGGCGCGGPMYYKGMIYPYCGPPLFDACNRAKVEHKKYCVPLEQYNPSNPVHMPYQTYLPCAWCWANMAIPRYRTTYRNEIKNV